MVSVCAKRDGKFIAVRFCATIPPASGGLVLLVSQSYLNPNGEDFIYKDLTRKHEGCGSNCVCVCMLVPY